MKTVRQHAVLGSHVMSTHGHLRRLGLWGMLWHPDEGLLHRLLHLHVLAAVVRLLLLCGGDFRPLLCCSDFLGGCFSPSRRLIGDWLWHPRRRR